MKILLLSICYTLLLTTSLTINSKTITNYQVEVILFEQVSNIKSTEHFDEDLILANTKGSLNFPITGDNKFIKQPLKASDPSLMKLKSVAKSLNNSSIYRVIKHIAWQQQGLDNNNAFKVRVKTNTPYVLIESLSENNKEEAFIISYEQLIDKWNTTNLSNKLLDYKIVPENLSNNLSVEVPKEIQAYLLNKYKKATIVFQLDGTIKVVRTRYLHFYTDLIWNVFSFSKAKNDLENKIDTIKEANHKLHNVIEEDSIFDPLLNTLTKYNFQSYPFKSHRKMRSKRKHYIDHPKIGIITIITPIKK